MSFESEVLTRIHENACDTELLSSAKKFMRASIESKYSYNITWLGRPIIQYPQDIVAMQEIIWRVKPDLIVETGIAHGGSMVFNASMLALLDIAEAFERGETCDIVKSKRKVIGIDIEIRPHNRRAIEQHPMINYIEMIEGSSVVPDIVERVREMAEEYNTVLVCLDSNHTHSHVLAELETYAPLTSIGSYCVVFDTIVEDMPADFFQDRPWGPGNNPKTAVREFLASRPEFEIDSTIENKLMITVAPEGYLKRIA